MARGRTTKEQRAQAQAMLLSGSLPGEVSRELGIPRRTAYDIAATLGPTVDRIREQRTQTLDQLIIEYLSTGFKALIAQASVLTDMEYLSRQDADKLALAHGVVADKLASVASTAQALGLTGPALQDQLALPEPGDDSDEFSGSD